MDSWVIVQGEVALTAIKNFPVVLESRGTMVVSRTGTSGQRDPHSSTEERVKNCTSESASEKLASQLGVRYTVLLELPYYTSIKMCVIDQSG